MFAPRSVSTFITDVEFSVCHFLGYDVDRGGIVSVIRSLKEETKFHCVLGMNLGCTQLRTPALETVTFTPIAGEKISLRQFWRARTVAREAAAWVQADQTRIFHAHSRAGLLVAWWLQSMSVENFVASVHCYGRHRWFYRSAARKLGDRLFWLTPQMRRYYGVSEAAWKQCIPDCAPYIYKSLKAGRRDQLVLGGIGSLVAWKGWHLVLEAIAALSPSQKSRLKFEHVGGPDGTLESMRYASGLKDLTNQLNLQCNVKWHGARTSSAAFLNEIDALVVASQNEPCSVAMLEALFAGISVIAADSGGALDIILPHKLGWLFRTGDSRDLSRALATLLEEGVSNRAVLNDESLSRYSSRTVAQQWLQVYRGLGHLPV